MTEYVALLRGVNVGGKHILPMADLRECPGPGCAQRFKNIIRAILVG
jgi:uncharacterized protein (DUF1697 family)